MNDDELILAKPGLHPVPVKFGVGAVKVMVCSLERQALNSRARANSVKGRDRELAKRSLQWLGVFSKMKKGARNGA